MTKLIQLSEEQMRLIDNRWHHAVVSYFEFIPTIEKRYPDEYGELTYAQIEDIIEEFEINPPTNHWYNKEGEMISNIFKNLFYGYIIYRIYLYIYLLINQLI